MISRISSVESVTVFLARSEISVVHTAKTLHGNTRIAHMLQVIACATWLAET